VGQAELFHNIIVFPEGIDLVPGGAISLFVFLFSYPQYYHARITSTLVDSPAGLSVPISAGIRLKSGELFPFQGIFYPFFQSAAIKRLSQIAIRTEVKTSDFAVARIPGSEHDDRRLRPLPELQARANTIERRHRNVQDYEPGLLGIDDIPELDAIVLGVDYLVIAIAEFTLHEANQYRVAADGEDFGLRYHLGLQWLVNNTFKNNTGTVNGA
jgi:hypothetical protein